METGELQELQELVLATIPPWHFYLSRPFKRLLAEDVSLEMYYTLQALRRGDMVTMTELSKRMRHPKQRMTKVVDRLVERGFVERVSDPSDRRIIRLRITDAALGYVDTFLQQEAGCYRELFEKMSAEERAAFRGALGTIHDILEGLPFEEFAPPCPGGCGKGGRA